MLQLAASMLEVPEDVLVMLVIVVALSFCAVFGALALVAMAAEIMREDS